LAHPRRKIGVLFAVALLILVLAVACFRYVSLSLDERPNFILIVTDDQAANTIAYMPNLQRLLVKGGTRFTQAFSPTPLCCPARATLLRGQYAHNHLVKSNDGTSGGFPQFHTTGHENSTLATWLNKKGYRTALVGKYFNAYPEGLVPPEGFDFPGRHYQPPGWDEWHAVIDIPHNVRDNPYNMYGYQLNHNGQLERYGDASGNYLTDVLGKAAVEFVDAAAQKERPFFLYLAPTAPHLPAIPAQRHQGVFKNVDVPRDASFNEARVADKPAWLARQRALTARQIDALDRVYRRQLESLLAVDETIYALVSSLKQHGEFDETYIVFTSDHGLHNGEHRLCRSKLTPYKASSRVPLLIRGPGVPVGHEVSGLTMLTDIAPTLTDLADAPTPTFVDGRSLVPLISSKFPEVRWRKRVLLEFWPRMGFPVDEREEPLHTTVEVPEYQALRSTRYLYVEYRYPNGNEETELYDLRRDPFELSNIALHADERLMESLEEKLNKLAKCRAATCREAEG
jgi:N-acetylglucosamine-6-sulfatase